jgi:hypothetical protein
MTAITTGEWITIQYEDGVEVRYVREDVCLAFNAALLEALEEIASLTPHKISTSDQAVEEAKRIARAAIKKAKGETE